MAAGAKIVDPRELIRIACAAAGIEPRKIEKIRYRNPRIEIPGLSKRARENTVDLAFTVHTSRGRTIEVWLFEIQCSYDHVKRRRWALYLAAFSDELDADARLVVFSPEPKLRGRIRTKLLPNVIPPPILLEPDQVERIVDYEEARRRCSRNLTRRAVAGSRSAPRRAPRSPRPQFRHRDRARSS